MKKRDKGLHVDDGLCGYADEYDANYANYLLALSAKP
jgi:hypothetical protein